MGSPGAARLSLSSARPAAIIRPLLQPNEPRVSGWVPPNRHPGQTELRDGPCATMKFTTQHEIYL